MKAIHMSTEHGAVQFVYEEAPQPQPRHGEVLVRVYATGVTPDEPTWSQTWKTRIGVERPQPIPGHEMAGIVEEVGTGITTLAVGEEVYGLTDFSRDGAEADYTLALPNELAPKPRSLTFTQAAAVPLAALTVWQAFFDHAHLSTGQTVLIHGAAGSVGSFAVQLAHWAGAHVIATATPDQHALLRQLGADELVDYTSQPFEAVAQDVDVVLDTIGGETLERSWDVLKPGGALISLVEQPAQERAADQGIRAEFFIVRPNRAQLTRIGELIDTGSLQPIVEAVLPVALAHLAYEERHRTGKTVLQVVNEEQRIEAVEKEEREALQSYGELGVTGDMTEEEAYRESFASGEVSREMREMEHGEFGPKAYEWLEQEREQPKPM
jgi:NADPH:quinone reductase-like Zn-dependent oxidoreductase